MPEPEKRENETPVFIIVAMVMTGMQQTKPTPIPYYEGRIIDCSPCLRSYVYDGMMGELTSDEEIGLRKRALPATGADGLWILRGRLPAVLSPDEEWSPDEHPEIVWDGQHDGEAAWRRLTSHELALISHTLEDQIYRCAFCTSACVPKVDEGPSQRIKALLEHIQVCSLHPLGEARKEVKAAHAREKELHKVIDELESVLAAANPIGWAEPNHLQKADDWQKTAEAALRMSQKVRKAQEPRR